MGENVWKNRQRLTRKGSRQYLYADEPAGSRIIGYGDDGFQIKEIERRVAVDIILRHHYSGRIVNNSYVHLGVFHEGRLAGALQWGYAMNPSSGGSIVTGTGNREYLELNRMWLDDAIPANGESMAISYAVRFIRARYPAVQWLQSFADERCGGLGVVYQACNFVYCGHHMTTFYHLDGDWFHEMLLTAHKKGGNRGAFLRENLDRAAKHKFRQFRYIYFIDQRARARLKFPILPNPKPDPGRDIAFSTQAAA
jgi:hypothetical protein